MIPATLQQGNPASAPAEPWDRWPLIAGLALAVTGLQPQRPRTLGSVAEHRATSHPAAKVGASGPRNGSQAAVGAHGRASPRGRRFSLPREGSYGFWLGRSNSGENVVVVVFLVEVFDDRV